MPHLPYVLDRRTSPVMTREQALELANNFGLTVWYRDARCLRFREGFTESHPDKQPNWRVSSNVVALAPERKRA